MSFTIVCYAVFLALVPLGMYIRFRTFDIPSGRFALWVCAFMALSSISIGLGYDFAMAGTFGAAAFFMRFALVTSFGACLAVFRLSFAFPSSKGWKWLDALSWAALIVFGYMVMGTNGYLKQITVIDGVISRASGDLSEYLGVVPYTFAMIALLVFFVRRLLLKNRIYRLQALIIIGSIFVGGSIALMFGIVLPQYYGMQQVYAFTPVGGFVIVLGILFGFSVTRLFDFRVVAFKVLTFAFFSLIYGVLVAAAAFLIHRIGGFPADALGPTMMAIFVLTMLLRNLVKKRLQSVFSSRTGYLDAMEKALAGIDFSKGRDEVIGTVNGILERHMDASEVHYIVEGAEGDLGVASSTSGRTECFSRKNAAIEHLLNIDQCVILKSDAMTNHNYADIRGYLLELFTTTDSECLIMLKEGRHVIGFLALGAKKSGYDYTGYDYESLVKVYAKIFVVIYYLKNIARESLLSTVDRELEFSNQIISSIQDNIDVIQHPRVDIHHVNRATRKLGGDFLDIVKLAPDRYFFCLGDVSGKGLNASMSMVILKSVIRTFLKETQDFKQLVIKVNRFIKYNLPRGTFFAGVFGLFDFAKSSLYYINCGVPVMLLYSPTYNNVIEIQGEGKVLGFAKDVSDIISLKRISFAPNSVLIATTDGLVDSENLRGDRYGKERLERVLQENHELNSERIVRSIYTSLLEFISREIDDDVSVLALKILAK